MRAPLYDEVHGLALDIVNASSSGDEGGGIDAYAKLKNLCDSHDGDSLDHPLQWEALGDFSDSLDAAISAYKKGLECALRLSLPEYTASIKFAMAETYYEQDNLIEAVRLVREARAEANDAASSELRIAIDSLLNELSNA